MLAVYMERNAGMLLLAKAAGKVNPVSTELARTAHDFMVDAPFIGATFNYFSRRVLECSPSIRPKMMLGFPFGEEDHEEESI